MRKTLDFWPGLPLIISGCASTFIMDDLIAALECRDHMCKIDLNYISPELGKFWAAMQEPFLKLTHLWLEAQGKLIFEEDTLMEGDMMEECTILEDPETQDVSDSFLGGSAPCLQFFQMNAI
jgi:hypothetical protein